ncbi:MAG: hypothetical protein IT202_01745 [Fimbriimonadaceae bacterium]|nr:hypothetical protein [Fimbriimonadaceae bacterium]QOJ12743.1 MAG: hypothetical protein HRU74_12045 [Chthonomonadaceae bacterium]
MYNEMWIRDFMAWVEATFPKREPGLLLEFRSVVDLNQADFAAFKQWFEANQPGFALGTPVEWTPPNAGKGILIDFMERKKPGFGPGVTWGAAGDYGDVVAVNTDDLRAAFWKRIKLAKRSFGFAPSDTQFNFVLVDVTDSPLYDEEDAYQALYGQHHWGIDQNTMTANYSGHNGSGIYFVEKPDYISGLVFCVRQADRREYAVYPHPQHLSAVETHWTKAPFRLGKAFEA